MSDSTKLFAIKSIPTHNNGLENATMQAYSRSVFSGVVECGVHHDFFRANKVDA